MRLISYAEYHTVALGKAKVRAFLISDSTPETMPTDGSGIIGMSGEIDFSFMPMSVLYITDSTAENQVYITKEDGTWTPLNGGISLMI
jgi:hypothetical protein